MGGRVLLVDDEESVLEALAMTLRRGRDGPFEVETAASGAAALDALSRASFDMVIADYRMPGMTGADLLARVKEGFPATVRALLTGYNDVEIAMEAMEKAAIHYYIQKPWDNDALRATVAEALAGGWRAGEHGKTV